MRSTRVVILLALFLSATGAAFASTIDIGASGSQGIPWMNDNNGANDYEQLAQTVTLNQSSVINSISLAGQGGTGLYDYEISNALTGGTVYWSASQTNPNGPSFSGLNLDLGAGTYYLLSLAQNGSVGWWYNSTSVVEMGGTVPLDEWWYQEAPGGPWGQSYRYPLIFDISGTTGVPEPASFVLLASGLLSLGAALRRKLR
jgi:hypothetical protein